MTDSNSGITKDEAKRMGIFVLPMPFYIDGKLYYEDVNLSQEEFYEMLGDDKEIHTSQPAPGDVTQMWDSILEKYDSIVYIPMSSGLSDAMHTAQILARQEPYENRVFIADVKRISVTQRLACVDALNLARQGHSAAHIKSLLEANALKAGIYIAIDNMYRLKKGGRITPAAAGIASILGIKPVLQIQGERLDTYAKTRGMANAVSILIEAIEKDLSGRFKKYLHSEQMVLGIAYAGRCPRLREVEALMKDKFSPLKIIKNPLALSVGCHTGEGALGVACIRSIS